MNTWILPCTILSGLRSSLIVNKVGNTVMCSEVRQHRLSETWLYSFYDLWAVSSISATTIIIALKRTYDFTHRTLLFTSINLLSLHL